MAKALIVLENHFFLDSNQQVWCDRVVDYNYLITEGTAMEKEVITELKSLVKSSGVIRGSL